MAAYRVDDQVNIILYRPVCDTCLFCSPQKFDSVQYNQDLMKEVMENASNSLCANVVTHLPEIWDKWCSGWLLHIFL